MKSFDSLYQELSEKVAAGMGNSAKLVEAGVHAIGKKIVEEAAEVWMAAEHESDEALALEISQLIYHLQLMMLARGISKAMIEERL